MRTLVFGGNGGIGKPVVERLQTMGYDVYAPRSYEYNLNNTEEVEYIINKCLPEVLIDLAVYNVDGMIHKTDIEEAEKQVQINSLGFLRAVRFALPHMREKKFGRIIYVSSVLSTRPIPGTGLYAATKSFSESIVRSVALENAKYGITCNSIHLGYCEAGIIEKVPENILPKVIDNIPLKRLGRTSEVCDTVKYILKTEYLTGANIDLSGGLHI